MIRIEEAYKLVTGAVVKMATEKTDIKACLHRVLAEDIISDLSQAGHWNAKAGCHDGDVPRSSRAQVEEGQPVHTSGFDREAGDVHVDIGDQIT